MLLEWSSYSDEQRIRHADADFCPQCRQCRLFRLEYRIKRRSAEFTAHTPYGRNGQIQSYGEVRLVRDYDAGPDDVESFQRR